MQLKVFKRVLSTKGETKRIRREGDVPGIIYVKGESTDSIAVRGAEFENILRSVLPGRLSTTMFLLQDENGKERKAILKEIQ
jgi:large subunit ribosomal protein L25